MRTLYFDLHMGAAGDMITAALIGLFDDPDAICSELNALGIPGVKYVLSREMKNGISGLHMRVEVDGEVEGERDHHHDHAHYDYEHYDHALHDHGHRDHVHHHPHRGLADIRNIIDSLPLEAKVCDDAQAVFASIAEAEAEVHGEAFDHIHFHEVGTMDAVADVVAVSYLMAKIAPDEVCASDICTGTGTVECAHGILPVPAPATAILLKGLPAYGGSVEGELCTPTGAAVMRHFVDRFCAVPAMRTQAIAYGVGTKDFSQANCLRAMLGERAGEDGQRSSDRSSCYTGEGLAGHPSRVDIDDTVVELACNIDDMTAEALGFALEQLMEAGALDAYLTPITMKKSRPAHMLCVIAAPDDEAQLAQRMFELTTTIGIRRHECGRYVLDRGISKVEIEGAAFRVKSSKGYGVSRCKVEYDDLADLARTRGISLDEARSIVEKELS